MRVGIIGGGASGMMAAYACASNGNDVVIFEKNSKLGRKLFITGKGRCNVTNDTTPDEVIKNTVSNPKFLYTAVNAFTPENVKSFFEKEGVALKTERGNRVFPESDKSSSIISALEKALKRVGVVVKLNTEVVKLSVKKEGFLIETHFESHVFDRVIVATGGFSYKATGSTGDGYKFAESCGHSVTDIKAALVPIIVRQVCGKSFSKYPSLEGLSLKNVVLSAKIGKKVVYEELGEMLFTDKGISGPLVLSASSVINRKVEQCEISLDLKPALSEEVLDARIRRDFEKNINKRFKNALDELLPKKLIPFIIKLSDIPEERVVRDVTKEERRRLVTLLKNLVFNKIELDDIDYGIITAGGVSTKEINPKNMESKLIKGLYFVGEVLDLDAFTGGFNLQIAFSTGYLAGNSIKGDTENDF